MTRFVLLLVQISGRDLTLAVGFLVTLSLAIHLILNRVRRRRLTRRIKRMLYKLESKAADDEAV